MIILEASQVLNLVILKNLIINKEELMKKLRDLKIQGLDSQDLNRTGLMSQSNHHKFFLKLKIKNMSLGILDLYQ